MTNKSPFQEFASWLINFILAPFAWSRWTDICVYEFSKEPFLLQGKVNLRTNNKKFHSVSFKGVLGLKNPDIMYVTMRELETHVGLIKTNVNDPQPAAKIPQTLI